MHEALGTHGIDEELWRVEARAELARRLGEDVVAVVVEAPDGGALASCAMAILYRSLPTPGRSPLTAHVLNVATDLRWRRRGMASAAVGGLVERLDALGVRRADLNATPDGEPMYRALGFGAPMHLPLTRYRPV